MHQNVILRWLICENRRKIFRNYSLIPSSFTLNQLTFNEHFFSISKQPDHFLHSAQRYLAASEWKRVKRMLRYAWGCSFFGIAKRTPNVEPCRGFLIEVFSINRALKVDNGKPFPRETYSIKFDNVVTNFIRVWPAMWFIPDKPKRGNETHHKAFTVLLSFILSFIRLLFAGI